MVEELKRKYDVTYQTLAEIVDVPLKTLDRWRARIQNGQAPVKKPGPKKVEPFDLPELWRDIAELVHGKRKSFGAGALLKKFCNFVSRRVFGNLLKLYRSEAEANRKAESRTLEWTKPGVVWAMDPCEVRLGPDGVKVHIQDVQDLASGYKFPPLAGLDHFNGEAIAGHLAHLFNTFGAPLFLKRDNGVNLNCEAVDQVLEEYMVIPINSPVRTPSYNGAVERAQGEIKRLADQIVEREGLSTPEALALLPEIVVNKLNHKTRRKLDNKNSCRTFFGARKIKFDKRARREVLESVKSFVEDVCLHLRDGVNSMAAWRAAAQQWLVQNKFLIIHQNKAKNVNPNEEVSPLFPEFIPHN